MEQFLPIPAQAPVQSSGDVIVPSAGPMEVTEEAILAVVDTNPIIPDEDTAVRRSSRKRKPPPLRFGQEFTIQPFKTRFYAIKSGPTFITAAETTVKHDSTSANTSSGLLTPNNAESQNSIASPIEVESGENPVSKRTKPTPLKDNNGDWEAVVRQQGEVEPENDYAIKDKSRISQREKVLRLTTHSLAKSTRGTSIRAEARQITSKKTVKRSSLVKAWRPAVTAASGHESTGEEIPKENGNTAIDDRPPPQGQPFVWADGRQALCETLPYFRGYQTGAYHSEGLIHGMLLDGSCHERDYVDATVVIARAGGGMIKHPETGNMVQDKDQKEDAQVKCVRNNIRLRVPIVLIVGQKNPKCPSLVPHPYCVMGYFKPTHVWTELDARTKTIKYRFEKFDPTEPSWWTPVMDQLSESSTSHLQPVHEACQACNAIFPRIYCQGWMCVNEACRLFWKIGGSTAPSMLTYDIGFLKQTTPWPAVKPPHHIKPDLIKDTEDEQAAGWDVSYAAWKGFSCPDCGRCNSREDWKGWKCLNQGCGFIHELKHVPIPARDLSDPNSPFTSGHAIPLDDCSAAIVTQVEFYNDYRVHTYHIPGCGKLVHFMANGTINKESDGPNDMWHELQTSDLGLKRLMAQRGIVKGGILTKHFVTNYVSRLLAKIVHSLTMTKGMPYKYAVAVDSQSFEGTPQTIRSARSRLNWAARYVLGAEEHLKEFNELLALGYFEQQAIHYHDDGETGLGPTVATLSLGFPAIMKIRMKGKYYTGLSNGGTYLDEPPLEGSLNYQARKKAHGSLDSIVNGAARKERAEGIRNQLKLSNKKGKAGGPDVVSMYLRHGDIVIMHGEKIQKYYEHAVTPTGKLRFALTCRYIDPASLEPQNAPHYEVLPDTGYYDGGNGTLTPPRSA
ncbi:MAG: hypothetical protein M1827_004744 [Pycnora praestabilis]|nr:MAG: hypothetical protein M1827_004744 [Pycnora praestabilis]